MSTCVKMPFASTQKLSIHLFLCRIKAFKKKLGENIFLAFSFRHRNFKSQRRQKIETFMFSIIKKRALYMLDVLSVCLVVVVGRESTHVFSEGAKKIESSFPSLAALVRSFQRFPPKGGKPHDELERGKKGC